MKLLSFRDFKCPKCKYVRPLNATGTTYGPAYPTTQDGISKGYQDAIGRPVKAGGF